MCFFCTWNVKAFIIFITHMKKSDWDHVDKFYFGKLGNMLIIVCLKNWSISCIMRFSVSKTNVMLTSKLKHISVIVGNLAKWASKLWWSQENLYHHSRIKTVWWKVIQIIDDVFPMLFHPFSLLSLSYFYTDLCLQDIHVEYSV